MTTRTTATDTILDRIVADKREELAARTAAEPLERLKERALAAEAPIPFAPVLKGTQLKLIAEIKKASPSKGILDRTLEPLSRARTYTLGGAAASRSRTRRRCVASSPARKARCAISSCSMRARR